MSVKDCPHPWDWLMITTDGLVKPCCFSFLPVGNLNHSSLEEIWNGFVMQELRLYVLNDRIHPVCRGAHCKFVQSMDFDEDWYLEANPDVRQAVCAQKLASGREHYLRYGKREGRKPKP